MGAENQDGGVGRMEVKEIRNRINKDVTFGRKPQGEQRGEERESSPWACLVFHPGAHPA